MLSYSFLINPPCILPATCDDGVKPNFGSTCGPLKASWGVEKNESWRITTRLQSITQNLFYSKETHGLNLFKQKDKPPWSQFTFLFLAYTQNGDSLLPWARSHLHLVGPRPFHVFFTVRFFYPHLHGISLLRINVTIPGHLSQYAFNHLSH